MEQQSTPMSGAGRIVVAVDFSEPSEAAIDAALRQVAMRPETEMHVVHAIGDASGLTKTRRVVNQEVLLSELPNALHGFVAQRGTALQVLPVHLTIHVRAGDAVKAILQMAVDVKADLIIVGTHGRRGVKRAVMGSVAEHVVRNAHCPVWVARPVDYEDLKASDAIEPPCPDCMAVRRETNNEKWWCEVHSREHVSTHTYSGSGRGFTHSGSDVGFR
jgi:nucleotide-binding universal stress UspA family protein